MNIAELLQGVDCGCGRHHSCAIGYVAIEQGAISHLAALCQNDSKVLLVADENTYAVAGRQTEAALAGKQVPKVVFPGTPLLIPNEKAVEAVTQALAGVQKIVAVGAGVIQDLCKYVSAQSGIPYYVVATAPSMDGYASSGAAMIMGGMKVTYSAKVPDAILADPAILKDAPFEMIQAGYGDIVGKYSALNDWRLSHCVNDEYFCQYLYDLTMDTVKKTLSLSQGLVQREEESVRVLMEALVVVGIAMSFAGSSRPASGSEHHLSHFFEITGILEGVEYFPHGIDVAYSAIVTAGLRQKLLERPFPARQFRLPRKEYEAVMTRIYGAVAPGCIALQDKMGWYEKDMISVYKAKEAEIRAILADGPSPQEIEAMVRAVGMDPDVFYSHYGEGKLNDAIAYAKDLKDRYSVLWLFYQLFGDKA